MQQQEVDRRPTLMKTPAWISQKLDFKVLDNVWSTMKKDLRDQEVEDDSMEYKPGDFNQFWPEDVIHKGGFDSPVEEEDDFPRSVRSFHGYQDSIHSSSPVKPR